MKIEENNIFGILGCKIPVEITHIHFQKLESK
jgi:hypothetical protein